MKIVKSNIYLSKILCSTEFTIRDAGRHFQFTTSKDSKLSSLHTNKMLRVHENYLLALPSF